jgi:hypothetical protein
VSALLDARAHRGIAMCFGGLGALERIEA